MLAPRTERDKTILVEIDINPRHCPGVQCDDACETLSESGSLQPLTPLPRNLSQTAAWIP
jgi:hypothetical protein